MSLDDYRSTVQKVPLLLEALGQCLPDKKVSGTSLGLLMSSISSPQQGMAFLDQVFAQEELR